MVASTANCIHAFLLAPLIQTLVGVCKSADVSPWKKSLKGRLKVLKTCPGRFVTVAGSPAVGIET